MNQWRGENKGRASGELPRRPQRRSACVNERNVSVTEKLGSLSVIHPAARARLASHRLPLVLPSQSRSKGGPEGPRTATGPPRLGDSVVTCAGSDSSSTSVDGSSCPRIGVSRASRDSNTVSKLGCAWVWRKVVAVTKMHTRVEVWVSVSQTRDSL